MRGLRFGEAVAMTGFVFAIPLSVVSELPAVATARSFWFALALVLHFCAIYSWNSFFGYEADRQNPRLRALSLLSRQGFFGIALALSVGSILAYSSGVGRLVALGGVGSLGLWMWYSFPNAGLKQAPFAGTALHAATGTLHGMMALASLDACSVDGLLVSAWFGSLFASGHVVHEAIDREADARASVRTACVRYGYRVFALLTLGYLPLLSIFAGFIVWRLADATPFLVFAGASVLHVGFAFRWLLDVATPPPQGDVRAIAARARFMALQTVARRLYAAAGILAVVLAAERLP